MEKGELRIIKAEVEIETKNSEKRWWADMKLETEKTDKKRGFRMGSKNKRMHDPVRERV